MAIVTTKFLAVRQTFKLGKERWEATVSTNQQTAPSPSGEGAAKEVLFIHSLIETYSFLRQFYVLLFE